MRSSIRLSSLAAIALSAAVRPVAAQRATTLDRTPVVALTDAATMESLVRPIVVYRFVGWRGAELPTEVAVSDSAGTIIASFRTPRAREARPMDVAVHGSDITLSGITSRGPLTLQLNAAHSDATDTMPIGRWTLGDQGGELRGRFTPTAVATAPRS